MGWTPGFVQWYSKARYYFFQRTAGELVGFYGAQKELWESGGGLSSDKRISLFLCGKAGGCQLKYVQHLYS